MYKRFYRDPFVAETKKNANDLLVTSTDIIYQEDKKTEVKLRYKICCNCKKKFLPDKSSCPYC